MGSAGDIKTALLVAVIALGGCAASGVAPSAPPRSVAALPPLPPASLGRERSAQQVVRAAFGTQEATMNCVVDISPQRMSVIALNAVGMRLFSVKLEDGQLEVERTPGVPEQVQPEQILRDIQLAYWPLPVLQNAWRDSSSEVSEPFAGTRRLKRDGRLIAEVHYPPAAKDPWRGRLWLSNFEFGYSLAVDSQAMDRD